MTHDAGKSEIPQSDPGAAYRACADQVHDAFSRVLAGGRFVLGPEVDAFETEFGAYCGVRHAVALASGTDAIVIALRALGLGPRDAVFTVSHTAVATVAAIRTVGALPILIDVDERTQVMDPGLLRDTLKRTARGGLLPAGIRPRAILPVHLYGHPAELSALVSLAQEFGLDLIEDCAQAHGAEFDGRRAGSFGRIGTFSFYPTKNLGALGDGGGLVTDDSALAERARLLRQYGWRTRYVSEIEGTNSRLDELQAALLRIRLGRLDVENEARRAIAAQYDHGIRNPSVLLPVTLPHIRHVYHQYVVRTTERAAFRAHLARSGIGTLVHYPMPIHRQPAYSGGTVLVPSALDVTERLAREVTSLPMYPFLTPEQVARVADAVNAWRSDRR